MSCMHLKTGKQKDESINRTIPAAHSRLSCYFFLEKLSSLWRVWGITSQLEKEGIELFHGLSNELPLNIHKSRIKSIVTIHDLIFLRYPQYYQSIDRKIYTYKFRKACENADKIIAISECTKRDIIRYFNIPDDKIEVVYQGCDVSFTHPVTEEKRRRYGKIPVAGPLYT